jgi:RNA-binding protein YlmH
MDRKQLLDRAGSEEDRLLLARILDKREQAVRRGVSACSDFLSPREQMLAQDALGMTGVSPEEYLTFGGYDGAERKVFLFLPEWQKPENAEFPLRCLRAVFRPEFHLSHRDFLGSLMGLGIVREKVGDLLVSDESCDLIVLESVANFLLQSWTQAGRAPLQVRAIALADLRLPEISYQDIRDTVQSLRLDALAATGLQMSRGKASALIESGRVEVNWRECVKPDHLLKEGDVVSARGFGKFLLEHVGGITRKGRTGILIKRYL